MRIERPAVLKNRQKQFKALLKTNRDLTVYVDKYRKLRERGTFTREDFQRQGVEVSGFADFFNIQEKAGEIPAGTVFIDNFMTAEEDTPHVRVLTAPHGAFLNYDDWRQLRHEIDKLFLEQGRVPL